MLANQEVVVIGGDARQLEVIHQLIRAYAKITLIGYSDLTQFHHTCTLADWSEIDPQKFDLVLLPVSGVQRDGAVEAVFHSDPIFFTEEMIRQTKPDCLFMSGVASVAFQEQMKILNRKLICLFDRDDLAIYNSIPTVEGTVMMVIQNTDFTIHQAKIAILGFGRIGMSLARTFGLLGARVKVGTRDSSDVARVFEMGLSGFLMKDAADQLSNVDVIIQTIPAQILDADLLSAVHPKTLIIDLASQPGGTDFVFAKKRGMKVIHALGLPGIVAPKTAGKMLAQVIQTVWEEEKGE